MIGEDMKAHNSRFLISIVIFLDRQRLVSRKTPRNLHI